MALTAKQWKLLRVLEHHDGHGTVEVAIGFGEYEAGDGADEGANWDRTRFVIGGLVRSLVRKGLARDDADGWGITAAGRAALAAAGKACGCNMCRMAREPQAEAVS